MDNGDATADDTAKRYMRRVAGGGGTTTWVSNEGCVPLRKKVAKAIWRTTWRIWGDPLPPPAQVRGDQPCAGNGCGVDKGFEEIALYCTEACRLRREMVKLEWAIGN